MTETYFTPSGSQRSIDVGEHSEVKVTVLGAGCEVGRSCIIVEYCHRIIMLDCGIHPGHSGIGALPVFDGVDVEAINLCLITHFHLDHCGALPYLVSKTSFKGKVLMTEPTKSIGKLLWLDYATMASRGGAANSYDLEYGVTNDDILFTHDDINLCMKSITTIQFRETIEYPDLDIQVCCYAAGHVLGAAMFYILINGIGILYTGDFSREVDRHVPIAEIPDVPVHVVICESTYGIRVHEPRIEREKRFLNSVCRILQRSGKVLMPIFALGRVQELLLILEEYWSTHPHVQSIPIWYCSPMSNRSLPVFETFISLCGDYVKEMCEKGINPFHFKYIKNARNLKDMKHDIFAENQPCVVLAAPGMLQNGTSRSLFELWCGDPQNGVILTGYSVRGTLADDLKKCPHSLQINRDGPSVQIKCSLENISFSAHSDFEQTYTFLDKIKPQMVFFVHGERGEMTRLAEKLKELKPNLAIYCPEILQTFSVRFPCCVQAKVIGELATFLNRHEKLESNGILPMDKKKTQKIVSSILLNKGNSWTSYVISPKDLSEFVPIVNVYEKRCIQFNAILYHHLQMKIQNLFEGLVFTSEKRMIIQGHIEVLFVASLNELHISWKSHPIAELLSEAILFLTIQVIGESTEQTKIMNLCDTDEDFSHLLLLSLRERFEDVELIEKDGTHVIHIQVFNESQAPCVSTVIVNVTQRSVSGDNAAAANVVREFLRRFETSLLPLPCYFSCSIKN